MNKQRILSVFFARLKPFSEIVFSDEHRRLSLVDFDNDDHLLQQQSAFVEFYRKNSDCWARFTVESNGYIYAVDAPSNVIVSAEWLLDRTPEFEMSVHF